MAIDSEELSIPGVVLVRPRRLGDHRGWFMETFVRDRWAEAGVKADFVQDNQSMSAQTRTPRGLHFPRPPFPQAQLVRGGP
ncbi:dTDP-4-dehydrorhamnose 3,5-epimerase family protein, partial [Nostoc sp. NIES-2111]